ncbi:UNVERIFIED_CONTAM: hypothetical protein NY603_30585, partial [Bacteroidetes bacterium 56_B9]
MLKNQKIVLEKHHVLAHGERRSAEEYVREEEQAQKENTQLLRVPSTNTHTEPKSNPTKNNLETHTSTAQAHDVTPLDYT